MSLLNLVLGLVFIGVLLYIVTLVPMDATIKRIINIVVLLVVVLWLVSVFFPGFGRITVP